MLLDAHRRLSRFIDESELTPPQRRPAPGGAGDAAAAQRWPTPCAAPARAAAASSTRRWSTASSAPATGDSLDGEPLAHRRRGARQPCRASAGAAAPRPPLALDRRRRDGRDGDPAAGAEDRQRRHRQGPARRPGRASLREQRTYAVDCCGDIRIGGSAGQERAVLVDDPFGGGPVHELRLRDGAVATSGIGRRCWIGADGGCRPPHPRPRQRRAGVHRHRPGDRPRAHRPAGRGLREGRPALRARPRREWLPHGGVIVRDGGEVEVVAAERPLPQLAVTS